MGLFDKKFCSVCGNKIGLMGNRKLEDGNLCKECAGKLSPWFSDRRSSTVDEIKAQLAYREENKAAVAQFRTTRTLGEYTKVLLDEDARKFMVTRERNLADANPDVLDYAQVTGCNVDVQEHQSEIYRKDKDGRNVSYNPKKFDYSYDFYCIIYVNHPYFDQIKFKLNNSAVKTGQRSINEPGAVGVNTGRVGYTQQGFGRQNAVQQGFGQQGLAQTVVEGIMGAIVGQQQQQQMAQNLTWNAEYNNYMAMGNEISDVLMQARQDVRDQIAAENAPKMAVTCPYCGATSIPDANGCCEYCGGSLNV